MTSPPYFGLRDFGGHRHWFDGDPKCVHDRKVTHRRSTASCSKCGAWWGQLGLEYSVKQYVEHLTAILAEVRRCLREDGTLWLVLGDSYREKRLLGVPHLVVQRLQKQGWLLRSEIVWHKSSALPEALHDRPTRSTESVFLLSKNGRYYYDRHALTEDSGANLRNVWSIQARGDGPSEHSAVFPLELPRRAIVLGTSEGGACGNCGTPLNRVTRKRVKASEVNRPARYGNTGRGHSGATVPSLPTPSYEHLGWERSCQCLTTRDVPCTVLDPFAGSGTTLSVASRLHRNFIGVELVKKYKAGMVARLDRTDG